MSTIHGTPNDDVLEGSEAHDIIHGHVGNDNLYGNNGNDKLYGNQGNDSLDGGSGNDSLDGGSGNDSLNGGNGTDWLYGGASDDYLNGGAGDDYLNGGAGDDYLSGGQGSDVYRFGKGSGQDTIDNYDYQTNSANGDTIVLGNNVSTDDVNLTRQWDDLVIGLNNSSDTLRVSGYFLADGKTSSAVENLKFEDGTIWSINTIKNKVQKPTEGDDMLFGYAGKDTLSGDNGNDTIYGYDGNDKLYGNQGNDSLFGGYGKDSLNGDSGNDALFGEEGNDSLNGGHGTDWLYGGAGNDHLNGGGGDDYLVGEQGSDVYRFGKGSGQDTIDNYDYQTNSANGDTIVLGSNVSTDDVNLTRQWDDLVIGLNNSNDTLRVSGYFILDASTSSTVENLKFEDGTIWSINTIKNKVQKSTGGDDMLFGYAGKDTLSGGNGNDTIYGYDGNDKLYGNRGNDSLNGGAGNDSLNGGSGDDYLVGEQGSDVYRFGKGSGQDTIDNYDYQTNADNGDTIVLGNTVNTSNIILTRQWDDLLFSFNDSNDTLRVSSYFYEEGASSYTVENVQFANGTVWDYADVNANLSVGILNAPTLANQTDSLISAMASFAPPAAGQIVFSTEQANTLTPVIAAS